MQLAQDPHKDTPLNYGGKTLVVLYHPTSLSKEAKEIITNYTSPSMVEGNGETGQYNVSYIGDLVNNPTDELGKKDNVYVEEIKQFVEYCELQNISYVEL